MKLTSTLPYNRPFKVSPNNQSKVAFTNKPDTVHLPSSKPDTKTNSNQALRLKELTTVAAGLALVAAEQLLGLSVFLKGNPYSNKLNTELFNKFPGTEFAIKHNIYINDDMTTHQCGEDATGCKTVLGQIFLSSHHYPTALHEAWHKESKLAPSILNELVATTLARILNDDINLANPQERDQQIAYITGLYKELPNGNLTTVDQKVDEILHGLPAEDYHGIKLLINEASYFLENNTLQEYPLIPKEVADTFAPFRTNTPTP